MPRTKLRFRAYLKSHPTWFSKIQGQWQRRGSGCPRVSRLLTGDSFDPLFKHALGRLSFRCFLTSEFKGEQLPLGQQTLASDVQFYGPDGGVPLRRMMLLGPQESSWLIARLRLYQSPLKLHRPQSRYFGIRAYKQAITLVMLIWLGWTGSAAALPLSAGDRLKLNIPEGEGFEGEYELNADGQLELPYVSPIPLAGLQPTEAEQRIRDVLVQQRLFQANFARVGLQVMSWAPIKVAVEGSVYLPGQALLQTNGGNTQDVPENRRALPGESAPNRTLTAALQAVGGIKPEADVSRVELWRQGQKQSFDLSGAFNGQAFTDVPLIAGDRIVVLQGDRPKPEQVRPSAITPAGIRVFVSNLTVPATSNASSAVSSMAGGIPMPYGSRFAQAVVAANCAGGTQSINAERRAMLVRTDRVSGKTKTWERSVEALLRNSADGTNPLLQEGDGIACYDAGLVGTADFFRWLDIIVSPFSRFFGPSGLFYQGR